MHAPSYYFRLLLAFTLLTPWVASAQMAKPVKASLVAEKTAIAPGESFTVAVKVEHEPHWHIYGKTLDPGITGKPTKLIWNLPEGWTAEDLPWPATKELVTTGGIKSSGYEDTVYLPAKLIAPANAAVGSTVKIELTLDALVCDPSKCMPVKINTTLELPIKATSEVNAAATEVFQELAKLSEGQPATAATDSATTDSAAATPQKSLALMLLYAFIGGLILNIMPCVFPVLGIKITSVVTQASGDRKVIILHGLAYTLGVLVSFWILVALLQMFNVTWGGQFQNPLFVYGIVLLFTVFGLNMAGLFEVGSSAVGVGSELTHKSGTTGSFFSGLLATIVSTPCSAPFLAPALVYGLSLSLFPSLLFFTIIGLGLAAPFLILSFSPALLKKLPRPGAWMESFKQAMSFLMLGAAAYFAWVLQGQVEDTAQRDILIGIVIVGLACWVYGRWCVIYKAKATRVKGWLAAALILSLGIWWGWPHTGAAWEEWSPEKVQQLQAEGKPVYIDFTARWCASCQYNKRVYKNAGLKKELERHGVVLLKADWTNYDDRITQALEKLERAAVPVNALYIPGKNEPVILPEILTVDNVKAALGHLDNAVPKTASK